MKVIPAVCAIVLCVSGCSQTDATPKKTDTTPKRERRAEPELERETVAKQKKRPEFNPKSIDETRKWIDGIAERRPFDEIRQKLKVHNGTMVEWMVATAPNDGELKRRIRNPYYNVSSGVWISLRLFPGEAERLDYENRNTLIGGFEIRLSPAIAEQLDQGEKLVVAGKFDFADADIEKQGDDGVMVNIAVEHITTTTTPSLTP